MRKYPAAILVLGLLFTLSQAAGLLMAAEADMAAYFKELDSMKEAIGSRYVFAANTQCLWGPGKAQVLALTGELLGAEYGRSDLRNVISGAILSLLDRAGQGN